MQPSMYKKKVGAEVLNSDANSVEQYESAKNEYASSKNVQGTNSTEEEKTPMHPRIKFLRKLYILLFVQLLIATALVFTVNMSSTFESALKASWFVFIPFVLLLIGMCLSVWVVRKKVTAAPLNWVIYVIFTALLAMTSAWGAAIGSSLLALNIFLTATLIVFSLFIYSLIVKAELTYQDAALFVVGSILATFELFLLFSKIRFDHLVFVAMGELIFAFYIIYDTQTMVNGTTMWSPNEWVIGTVIIYADLIHLIMKFCDLIRNLIMKERS
jgi:FtsH-binding integral membrane protein